MSERRMVQGGRTATVGVAAPAGRARSQPMARTLGLRRPFPEPPPAWCCAPPRLEISPLTIRLDPSSLSGLSPAGSPV